MKYAVAELEGALLDAAVAKAEGHSLEGMASQGEFSPDHRLYLRGELGSHKQFSPSTVWEHGGPIIERESLAVFRQEWSDGSLREWKAGSSHDLDEGPKSSAPTPLIAAMRAYVSSKFGETVELP